MPREETTNVSGPQLNARLVRAPTRRALRHSGRIAGYRLFSLSSRLDNAFDPRNSFIIMNARQNGSRRWNEESFFSEQSGCAIALRDIRTDFYHLLCHNVKKILNDHKFAQPILIARKMRASVLQRHVTWGVSEGIKISTFCSIKGEEISGYDRALLPRRDACTRVCVLDNQDFTAADDGGNTLNRPRSRNGAQ